MSENEQKLFMQVRILRLAAGKWDLPLEQTLSVFQTFDVFDYIDVSYGIFHCEGDNAVLDDIEEMLVRKGAKLHAAIN